jgi:DNA-binding HxlR family transcriptional regulator
MPLVDDPRCAVRLVLDRVADKWTALIVAVLSNGPARYGQLRRAVVGISEKMLAQTLRALERDGLVDRRVVPASPVRVEYELTRLGHTLVPALAPLTAWAARYGGDIVSAQERYDTSHAGR